MLKTKFTTNYSIESFEIIAENNHDLFYVFHLLPEGFILIAADDVFYPVIGYSNESNLILEYLPENIQYLFKLSTLNSDN